MELNSVVAADGGGGGDGGRAGGDSSSSRTCTEQPASAATWTFGSQHLAEVLYAAFRTKQAMQGLVINVKSKNEAFTGVTKSQRTNGKNIFFSSMQMAESIAKCRPDGVSNAEELLSWIVVSSIDFNVSGVVSRLL